jgi:hypothetical protein
MIAFFFAFLLSFLAPPAMDTDPAPASVDCAPVDAYALDDATLESMLDAGWAGRADDGTEALYAPGCAGMI